MKPSDKKTESGITRRDALKYSGLALGGMVIGGNAIDAFASKKAPPIDDCSPSGCPTGTCDYPPDEQDTQQYTYFSHLEPISFIDETTYEYIPPASNEMRITFMGSTIPPELRRAQNMMSIFVEVGDACGEGDRFVFDCGSGVCTNYNSMGVSFGKMDKIFLTHLHGDHMSDLTHIYCFGAVSNRKSPLFVWGPAPSRVESPITPRCLYDDGANAFCRNLQEARGPGSSSMKIPRPPGRLYDDGVNAFCRNLREACRWHSESQSFISTSYKGYEPPTRRSWGLPCNPRPVSDDPPDDGYAMIPIELDWRKYGRREGDNVAYHNRKSGVKITHFPVIHTRKGSIGYKLEWNGLSMVYTGDTKPEYHSIAQAKGVDVFIHEMNPPAEVWTFKNLGLTAPPEDNESFNNNVDYTKMVQNSSHTTQGAFGYLLSQIDPLPRLTVATHFPVADDMVECALNSVQAHFGEGEIVWDPYEPNRSNMIWSFDLMVLRVTADEITQHQGVVSDFAFQAPTSLPDNLNPPKYWTFQVDEDGNLVYDEYGNPIKIGDPYAQIDTSTEIPSCDDGEGNCNYREDGY